MSRPSLLVACLSLVAACGDAGSDRATCAADSTLELVQLVFERHGCTAGVCHGEVAEGGLDLRAESAYRNLVNVPGEAADLMRVSPGDEELSLLYVKLAARTDNLNLASLGVAGSAMPVTGDALTTSELTLIREWIRAGAPETALIAATTSLLQCPPP